MHVPIFVVSILLCGSAAEENCGRPAIKPFENNVAKIVGGREVIKHSWPWQTRLGATIDFFGVPTVKQFCGASIIDRRWIVTAAHCIIPGMNDTYVRVGQHNETLEEIPTEIKARNYYVKRIISHPDYQKRNAYDNDIALLELYEPIEFADEISPVCLPPSGSDPTNGTQCIATGWGVTQQRNDTDPLPPLPSVAPSRNDPIPDMPALSDVLRQVTLSIVTREFCNSPLRYNGSILETMFCASGGFGKDTCQSDSGGPLVCKNEDGAFELVGVVSWGKGCGDARYPGAYARVGFYLPWIKAEMSSFSCTHNFSFVVIFISTVLSISNKKLLQ